jgi:alanyl-tRNA synthetase
VAALVEERRRLERELLEARKALASGGSGGPSAAETVAGVSFIARRADGVPARELKGMVDQLKQDMADGVVVVAAADEGKVSLVIGVTEALSKRLSAVDLVRVGAEALGGKGGGGRPDMAQAGGADPALIEAAFAAVRNHLVSASVA